MKKAQRSSGAAIIPINGTGTDWLYCCNAVHGNGDGLVCSTTQREPQDPFEVFNSYVIPGVAALSNLVRDPEHTSSIVANGTITGTMKSNCTNDEANNVTTSSLSSSPSSSSCHDVAIGAGVGVPLGVIALLSIAWALWERMKRKSMSLQSVQPTQSASNKCRNSEPTELQTFSYEPNELDGSSRGG
ncbi:hypothetical protein N7457_005170 [Penicillium paradoxum]|uniref:uncharacterized protein n=1 Tax=Penicillium paradoxum TaxID=176176 RepID=UPI0025479820|nr:uncharacterized protein N7457_005170 [Penicillium paradoxum]KAJ5780010.1 hypothetical protein N7457_005170 [Penicillium paradoxum]